MKRAGVWPGMVFGLIGLNVTIVGITLYLAHSDASFAVEPDYYGRAVDWDRTQRASAASAALGWRAELSADSVNPSGGRVLTLRLRDRSGGAVDGADASVEAFASLRAGVRRRIGLAPVGPGLYAGPLGPAEGAWEFRITAARGAERFEDSLELLLGPLAGESE